MGQRKYAPTPSVRQVPGDLKEYTRCVEVVKSSGTRWPSAYASGMVVQLYKRNMAAKGRAAYPDLSTQVITKQGLARWFAEKWVDIRTGKPCGASKTASFYPTCRPTVKITSRTPVLLKDLTQSQTNGMIIQKQLAKKRTVRYEETKKKDQK